MNIVTVEERKKVEEETICMGSLWYGDKEECVYFLARGLGMDDRADILLISLDKGWDISQRWSRNDKHFNAEFLDDMLTKISKNTWEEFVEHLRTGSFTAIEGKVIIEPQED